MKEKITTVNDDPQFKEVSDSVTRCQLELLAVTDHHAQIEMEVLGIKETPPSDDDQWSKFKSGSTIDTRAPSRIDGLRAKQGDLQQREAFLTEALEQGRIELDKIRGKLSLEICKSYRSEFAKDAKETLQHLKALSDVTERTRRRRENLEQAGSEPAAFQPWYSISVVSGTIRLAVKYRLTEYGLSKPSLRFLHEGDACVHAQGTWPRGAVGFKKVSKCVFPFSPSQCRSILGSLFKGVPCSFAI